MAHFAKISETNEVLSVEVVDNKDLENSEGVEEESIGQQYLETHAIGLQIYGFKLPIIQDLINTY